MPNAGGTRRTQLVRAVAARARRSHQRAQLPLRASRCDADRDHGIYASKEPPPIDGEVFVYSIEPDRTFRVYPKIRTQAKAVR